MSKKFVTILIMGVAGSGKTTIAKLFSKKINAPPHSRDLYIFFIRVIQLLELYYQFFVYLKQLHAYDGAIK